tara:strand:+ start:663 stop:2279 length:1617 start_codon:yes stop_codon:yes gene_type:complete
MPLSRNQPSPERQSVLSFVSPSVADLLFYETVDAKTVGAGTGVSISSATWSAASVSVPAGTHKAGFTVTVNTSSAHQFLTGDVVTIDGLGSRENDSGYFRPSGTHEITKVDADTFTFYVREQPDASSPLDVSNNARVYLAHPSYGTAHPDTEKFPRHKLCYVKQADGEGLYFEYYYAADRRHQDDYNFEFSQADLGGNKYDTVVRTYVTLRSDFSDTDAEYQAGDAMPDPTSQFAAENIVEYHDGAGSTTDEEEVSTDYILMTRQQKRIGDQELDSLFVVEQRVYFRRVDIVSQSLDPATGGMLKTVVKLVHRGEDFATPQGNREAGTTGYEAEANWGLSTEGQNFETQQLSNDWWQVTIQDVIPQGLGTDDYGYGTGGKKLREYTTWQNFTWPSVVDGLVFTTANRKDGASQTVVTVRMKEGKAGHSGPTKMTVRQIWKKTAMTPPTPTVFKPTSARYSGVQYSVSVSNVLSPAITLTDFIGTEHPTYKMGEYAFPKPWLQASDPTDWPAGAFEGAVSQKPFRGGYLLEVVLVHPPA